MSGLFLGLIGGLVASGAIIVGALFILFNNNFNKETLLKLRLDFVIGIILIITAASLQYTAALKQNIDLGIAAFFLGALFLIFSKNMLKRALEMTAINNLEEQKSVLFIMEVMLKNIMVGVAAGAVMNMENTGEVNSLLTVLAIHNLLNGAAMALCFLSLGMEPLMAIMGASFGGGFAIVAGMFGGYLCQESTITLSLVMAFVGGALMSAIMQEAFSIVKNGYSKILLNPKFSSAITVMLIFIIWKELL